MRAWSLLLRLMLAFALVLNGATPALAGSHAPASAPTTAAAADDAHEQAPCHAMADALAQSPVDEGGDPAAPSSPDCCGPGACQCACVHLSQAVLPVVTTPTNEATGPGHVRPADTLRAAPALPHLIRPPIRQGS